MIGEIFGLIAKVLGFIAKILAFFMNKIKIVFNLMGKDLKNQNDIKKFRNNKKRLLRLNDEI